MFRMKSGNPRSFNDRVVYKYYDIKRKDDDIMGENRIMELLNEIVNYRILAENLGQL